MIRVTNSCGDCGFISGDYEDFQRHIRRVWHTMVVLMGMDAALDKYGKAFPDARRAWHIFREGGNP